MINVKNLLVSNLEIDESNRIKDNNDPCIKSVQVKPDLIDLEAYSVSHGDKAQAA